MVMSAAIGTWLIKGLNIDKQVSLEYSVWMLILQGLSHQVLLACVYGKLDVLQLMLAHSDSGSAAINLNAALPCHDSLELTPLSIAAISNQPAVCKVLMKAGAGVNHVDGRGCSALHWAVLAAHSAVVRALLANGAKPDTVDCEVQCFAVEYFCVVKFYPTFS